jgi:hypothetical protein
MKPEEGLLQDLAGQLLIPKVSSRETEEDGTVPLEQRAEGRLIPINIGLHQLLVGGCSVCWVTRHRAR